MWNEAIWKLISFKKLFQVNHLTKRSRKGPKWKIFKLVNVREGLDCPLLLISNSKRWNRLKTRQENQKWRKRSFFAFEWTSSRKQTHGLLPIGNLWVVWTKKDNDKRNKIRNDSPLKYNCQKLRISGNIDLQTAPPRRSAKIESSNIDTKLLVIFPREVVTDLLKFCLYIEEIDYEAGPGWSNVSKIVLLNGIE